MNRQPDTAAREWAEALCFYAGKDSAFFESFWSALKESQPVYREFVYYLENQNFYVNIGFRGIQL